MLIARRASVLPLLALAVAAPFALCAQTAPAAATADSAPRVRAATAELGERWDFEMDVNGRTSTGEFWIWRRGDAYTGTLTVRGRNALPIPSMTIVDGAVRMTVDTPDGVVTVAGTAAADGRSLTGIVTYHHGERFPIAARRREAAATGGR